MAKMVGLSRPIKIEWLNKTVELILQSKPDEQIKEELNEYLSFEISSPTNLRKTREILLTIWVKTPDEDKLLKAQAVKAYETEKSNRLAVHWCMILLAYPVFADVCGLIGKVSNIQDTFTTSWLKEKLFELWGERTTLLHSVDKLLQTLKYLGVIETMKTGCFKVKKCKVTDLNTINLIVLTIVQMQSKAYYEIGELSAIPQMFPFEYSVSHEQLNASESFTLNNFGGKIVLTGH